MAAQSIPCLIHQLWKTEDVPPRFRHWQSSWSRLNPRYEYRLWRNSDIERLVAEDYPEWSATFYGYRDNIFRVDLARYLILKKHGGIYADLDFECLRPMDPLLNGRSFVVGAEPHSHSALAKAQRAQLAPIVCNAWMASVPQHPFWDHLLDHLKQSAGERDVLDVTGPFALTRALRNYRDKDVTVLRPELLYPVDKEACWDGQINELEFFEEATRDAFAIHYWEGSWFRPVPARDELRLPKVSGAWLKPPEGVDPVSPPPKPDSSPLISCLMVTRGKPDMVRQAIRCFQAQTYERTELVIVTEADPKSLALLRSEYDDPRIGWNFVQPTDQLALGALRNIAIDAARGEYVVNWDDDDLHDPSRLWIQMQSLLNTGAKGCMLRRWVQWWPDRRRLWLSQRRPWEGSLLCLKSVMPRYPNMARGEDTRLMVELAQRQDIVVIDTPRLYVYVVHGENTWDSAHFERLYGRASVDFSGPAYDRVLNELGRRMDLQGYPLKPARAPSAGTSVSPRANTPAPKVLVLTPMRNTAPHLARYFELVQALDYPRERLGLCILEGDSTDGTYSALLSYRQKLASAFARFEVHQHHTGFTIQGPRWRREVQRNRRSVIAQVRNRLLSLALRDEEWVLWLDADLTDYPPSLLSDLLGAEREIVVPCCVGENGKVFDKNTFSFKPNREAAEQPHYLHDGIFQAPSGHGRAYLDDYADQRLVPVDAVGGTALLVRADLHRQGLVFPTYSHRGYIETEGLAAMAHDMGVQCWGMPGLRIVHGNH